jgi:Fe-Mn family superoxide dismutase
MISEEKLQSIEQLSGEGFLAAQFSLPPLPYAYDALEPFIDKQTMELHYDKHHQAYVDKLNAALQTTKNPAHDSIEEICKNINSYSEAVRNNGGGHYNHSLFWSLMKENKAAKPNESTGTLLTLIKGQFNSVDEFKKQFNEAAMKRFGSGWAWLVKEKGKSSLKISSTPNQDNPLMPVSEVTGTPILALDVWEHAYYLKYQNKRADYINAWWNVVNWDKANELFTKSAD